MLRTPASRYSNAGASLFDMFCNERLSNILILYERFDMYRRTLPQGPHALLGLVLLPLLSLTEASQAEEARFNPRHVLKS